MKPEGPLPCSQDFATCPHMRHMNPVHTTLLFLQDSFQYYEKPQAMVLILYYLGTNYMSIIIITMTLLKYFLFKVSN
jgi:hypothetical protein